MRRRALQLSIPQRYPTLGERSDLEWILDSGAYSAWRQKKKIDVEAYLAFIRQYQHLFHYVVCLDTIPGEFGAVPSPAEVERAAELSYENFLYMKEALGNLVGVERLIPVYHQGEQLHHLERLIEAGASYVGISPTNGLPLPERIRWGREVMKLVPKTVKTHGFGITTRDPDECIFHSMDSSSWSMSSGYGIILAPSATGWTWVHITTMKDAGAEERVQDTVERTRKKVPELPAVLTASALMTSPYARAVWNLIVQRASIRPHRCYAPVLIDALVTSIRFWSPKWILASYWFLQAHGGLLKLLTAPAPSEEEALDSLNIKREYRATVKRRGKPTGPILPGLA